MQWILAPVLVFGTLTPLPVAAPQPACGHPAQVLDLKSWKLTLPTGSKGHPTEVKQPALATYEAAPWFTPDAQCDGVRFRAAVNGVTTSGSGYPRSELREMSPDGSREASWSTTSGTSTLEVDEAVTHLPRTKDHVVTAQIHDRDEDVTVFRLEGSKLYVTKGDDTHYRLVTSDYRLGTRFRARFVAGGGQVRAYYNDQLVATTSVDSSGDYFKAGVYTQANCGNSEPCSADNYGEVTVYGLRVSHQG
ncbi:polysaccharide lyase family 7 protein [Kutzneria viridogrisea]|uniref:Alginate lyase 2 domain-containing protein n=1 Tax=Kutzneria viridogrisea TaxID=47990 RepID=A0ABR6BBA8_9PSEU|nr:hypothetical protein [Kutzneria viridogrisea]